MILNCLLVSIFPHTILTDKLFCLMATARESKQTRVSLCSVYNSTQNLPQMGEQLFSSGAIVTLSDFMRAFCSLSRVAKCSPKICPYMRANC